MAPATVILLTATVLTRAQTNQVPSPFGKLPMHFESNRGQSDGQVQFLARGAGYTLFLTPSEAVLSLRQFDIPARKQTAKPRMRRIKEKYQHMKSAVLRMQLSGANPQPHMQAVGALAGKANYFIGSDPSAWLTDVPIFSSVKYEGVYPGIDLLYYGDQGQLEYDLVVAPSADASVIALTVEGADVLEVDAEGNLAATVPGGGVLWRKPVVYQRINGRRSPVQAGYKLKGKHVFGFQIGDYDVSQPLIIDPALSYSTYLGGSSDDEVWGIAVDAKGFAYVAGDTSSTDFPTKNPPSGNSKLSGVTDAFITKLGPSGSNLVFSVYIGGTGFDSAQGIAVDKATNVYVTGFTDSSKFFPTVNAFQSSLHGADDVFVTKFNSAGSSILYSTYFGGTNDQTGYAIAVDTNGNAYVTGDTMSDDFPTKSAFQPRYGGAFTTGVTPLDAFVAKFKTTASGSASLVYSTYLGGEDDDSGQAIAVDSIGNAYVTGYSYSTGFPTTVTAVSTDGFDFVDAIVSKLSPTGSNLLYSTYLGGDGGESGQGIALDQNGFVYVTGYTDSLNFPTTPNAFMPVHSAGFDNVFVAKMNLSLPGTNALLYSTFLGGNNNTESDSGSSIAVDSNGVVSVTGFTGSSDFPVSSGAFQPVFGGGNSDAFVAKLNPSLSGAASLVYSTYLGGSDDDVANSIALDPSGNAYVAGGTFSTNFPTSRAAFQKTSAGSFDAFVTKIVPSGDLGVAITSSPNPVVLGSTVSYSVTVTNLGEMTATSVVVTDSLPATASFVSATATTGACSQVGSFVICNLGTMANGDQAGITIVATAVTPGFATNVARVSSQQVDGNTNNNTAVDVNTFGSVVTIAAPISNAFEAGQIQGKFKVSRAGTTQTALTVNYTVSGTATPGVDYQALPGSVTIIPGLNAAIFSVTPIDDSVSECPETVVVTLTTNAAYAIGSPLSATVTIIDNDLPTVSIAPTTPTAVTPGPTNGVFTVSRIGCTTSNLTVNYIVSGTASNGVDYTKLNGSVTIPIGALSQTINVVPTNPGVPGCPKTVSLAITTNANFNIGAPTNATVTIINNNPPTVTLAVTQPNAAETGPTNGVFTVSRNGCLANSLTVNYNIGGTATDGLDYVLIGSSVTIPSGLSSATITVVPADQAAGDGDKTVTLGLAANAAYAVGAPNTGAVTIADSPSAISPLANFTGSPTNGLVPVAVTFIDTSSGTINNRAWDFGDGTATNIITTSITHTYTNAGTYSVSLTVSGPLGTTAQTRNNYISLVGPMPILTVTPASQDFASVTIGQTNTLPFAVINTGNAPLNGTASAPAPFAVSSGSPYNVAAGQTGTVMVGFIPTFPGPFNANVTFASNGGSSTNAVTGVSVTAGLIQASPSLFAFGAVSTGLTAQATIVVTNLGGTLVSNGVATATGGPFAVVSGNPFKVSAFAATNIVVRFSPVTVGAFTNSIIFTSANGGSATNTLTGIGAIVPAANFTATPTNGPVSLTVTFTDISTGTITNRFWDFGDGTTFSTNAMILTHTYIVGGSYTVGLTVSGPLGASTSTKTNLIRALKLPQQVINPVSRDYSSVTIGQTNTLSFSVINTGDLDLTGTATTVGPYTVASGSPYVVAGSQTGTVAVSFIPVTTGTFNTNIVFNSNGGISTNSLSAVGITPGQIGVSPATLNFGITATGTTNQAVFTVTNSGGSTVSNGTATVIGGPYTIFSGGAFTLLAGASTDVVVSFAPVAAGGFTNSIAFNTANGGNLTNALIGTGAVVPAASFTATPTNGVAPLMVTFTDTSTGTITNRFWSFGDGTTLNTTALSVTNTYTTARTNTVRLIVTGPVGVGTNTQNNLIHVINPPQLVVSPAGRDYGAVTIGLSNSLTFAVLNTGDQSLTGTATTVGPYAVTAGSPYTVSPGQTGTTVSVTFAPLSPGAFNATVVFTSNGGASTNTLVGAGVTAGQIGVSPTALDFGTIATGTISQAVFTVSNGGGTAVTNGIATVSGGPYSVVAGAAFNIAPGGSTNVTVRFAPVAAGGFTNAVLFASANGGSSTNALTGSGAVVPAASFTATPTNGAAPLTVTFTDTSTGTITNRFWSFGDNGTTSTLATNLTHTYTTARTNTVRLIVTGPVGVDTNTQANLIVAVNPAHLAVSPANGNFGPVTIGLSNSLTFAVVNSGDMTLSGTATSRAPYAVVGGSPYTVAGGQTGIVTVSFSPVTPGPFNDNVIFTSNGGNSTNAVSGVGLTPGHIGVAPVALDYGVIATGTTSQRVFVVTNSGSTTVTNGTATVTGGPFAVVSGNTFSLVGGASTNVVVRFAPVAVGGFTNAVLFASANGGSSTNALTGSGAVVPTASFTATPTNGAAPLMVTFTDTSTGTITNRFWSFGDGTTLNTIATNLTHTYAVAGTDTVQLTASGPLGVSTITTQNLIVVVNPPHLVASPASRDFGAITIGLTSNQTFVVANTGDLPLNGFAAAVPPFAVVSGSPYTVAGGQAGTITVSFTPVAAGTFNNNVIFTSNGGGSTNPVAGVGLTPGRIVVSPPSLDYGTLAVSTSLQGLITVSNVGGTTVSNGTAVVTGGPFMVVSGSSFDLTAGASVNVIVSFTPSAAGAFTNAVIFNSADGGSATNSLTGSAAFAPVVNFSAAPTEGLLPLAVTFTDESTGTINGRQWTFGDGATSTATSPTHTYTNSGVFTVQLSVVGPVGTNANTKTDLISVVDPNLFIRLAGTYYGLSLGETQTFANSGLVVLKINTSGGMIGTFQQGTKRNSFAGLFDKLGHTTVSIPRLGLTTLTAHLHLDGNGSDQVTGTVTEASFTAALVADRVAFGKTTTASPLAGHRYTLLLAADTTNTLESVPLGDGCGTVMIKAPGTVQLSGVTGDGQKVKQTVPISKHRTWPLYVPLYHGLGAVFGWVTHTNIVAVSDLDASLHWSKPTSPTSALYPAGFADDIGLVGSEYVPPTLGSSVISVSGGSNNARVTFGNGDLPAMQGSLVTLTAGNLVLSTNLTLKITAPTGLFRGIFHRADNGKTVRYQGAILQKQNFGSGFFLGTNESGFVTFEPTP